MTAAPLIQLEIADRVATLRLHRPEVRNALSYDLVEQFRGAVETIRNDAGVGAVVLTGSGPSFSAGADLNELAGRTPAEAIELEQHSARVFDEFGQLPVITLAAIDGYAVGGGFLLSLFCDLRLATPEARLGFPPVAAAWLPPWAMGRLASWVGPARAEQLVLTGGMLSAPRAAEMGLVDQLVPQAELLKVAQQRAAELSHAARHVVAETRRYFRRLPDLPTAEWDAVAATAFARCLADKQAQDAIEKFLAARRSASR